MSKWEYVINSSRKAVLRKLNHNWPKPVWSCLSFGPHSGLYERGGPLISRSISKQIDRWLNVITILAHCTLFMVSSFKFANHRSLPGPACLTPKWPLTSSMYYIVRSWVVLTKLSNRGAFFLTKWFLSNIFVTFNPSNVSSLTNCPGGW